MESTTPGSYLDGKRARGRSEKPSPLRIVKRFGSEDSFCSPRSPSTRSMRSMQECNADDGCLTIMKRRRERSREGLALDGDPRDVADSLKNELLSNKNNWGERMVCKGGMLGSQTLNVKKTRQPRPSIHSHLGLRMQCARTSPVSAYPPEHTLENPATVQEDGLSAESSMAAFSKEMRPDMVFPGLPPSNPTYALHHLQNRTCILCPQVVVKAEVNALDGNQRTVWAAIEVSGRLSTIGSKATACDRTGVVTGTFIDHELDRFFEFGCLYDLTVEVLPTPMTAVVQVLREQTFPTTIYAGSSILLLAEIRIDVDEKCFRKPSQKHVRQKSEELIEDLEIQLGSSEFNYMHVKLSYAHSVFPESACNGAGTGVSSMHSRLETMATASLKRHVVSSPWSPRPAPSSNPLFQLVKRHWGDSKASEAMQKMLATRSCPRKPAKSSPHFSLERKPPAIPASLPTDQILPVIPLRQASLQKKWTSECCAQDNEPGGSDIVLGSNCSTDSRKSQGHTSSKESRSSKSRSCASNIGSSEDSETFFQKRGTLGRDGLKSLFPDFADLIPASYDGREKPARSMATAIKGKGKKETGRWAWASWF